MTSEFANLSLLSAEMTGRLPYPSSINTGAGDPNSGPHASVTSGLSTGPALRLHATMVRKSGARV